MDQHERDQKIIAVPRKDPRHTEIQTLEQIFPHTRRELEHFFSICKELEGRTTRSKAGAGPTRSAKQSL